jgi:hypothetical protein
MDAPDTVTEAVEQLAALGYVDDADLDGGRLVCRKEDQPHPLASAVVDHQYRFEGESDPGDEVIVLGLTLPEWGRKAVLVSAYGHDADPEHTEALLALTR